MQIKQHFHLEPDIGLLNDPNGLIQYKGEYYVFFQWNRFEKNHTYKEWGLFTSKDLLHWDFKASAILPDQEYDLNGVYSGSSCLIDDKIYIFYTGNRKYDGVRQSKQCLAISDNGRNFLKKGIIINTPSLYTEHFRDPKVLKLRKNKYLLVIGAQDSINKLGAIALYYSKNGIDWQYHGKLGYSLNYQMIECPDLFNIKGHFVLAYCLQSRDNTKDIPLKSFSVYKFIDFVDSASAFENINLDEDFNLLDYGFDFYAPQTFKDDRNRQILWAWMSRMNDEEEIFFAKKEKNIHCLTMPRELFIENGKLYQKPLEEFYKLLSNTVYDELVKDNIVIDTDYTKLFFKINSIKTNSDVFLMIKNIIRVSYKIKEQKLSVYRINWINNEWEERTCSVDKLTDIEIWLDSSSVEIFLNQGEYVFSLRLYPQDLSTNIKATMNAKLLIKQIYINK